MSVKILIQNKQGLPSWALTELVFIVRKFDCCATLRNNEVVIDCKKILQVVSMIKTQLLKIELCLDGDDEEDALEYIQQSNVGQFISEK